jgi:hypothetical protein
MADYFTYGQFVSCTNLVDFQQDQSTFHKMNLAWSIPATDAYKYDRVELYRYIGGHMSCVNPSDITESYTGSRLIYTAKQNTTATGSPLGTTTITVITNTKTTISTLNVNLTAVDSFVDDFSTLTSTGMDLDTFHSLPGVHENQEVINDIGFTRRPIYYILKTYIKGVTDSAPYLLTPDWKTKIFANHSSKTQVRHDYLHYEGDEIWSTLEAEAGNTPGISRTAVDINRLYLDATQSGPTGRGGYAWVSDRTTNKVFQHNLKDGYTAKVWSLGGAIAGTRGFGIGIDGQTGDCIAGPGGLWNENMHPTLYRCKIGNGLVTTLMPLPNNGCAYGIIPLFNNPDKMLITDYYDKGYARILNLSNNTVTQVGTQPVLGYAAAACPNGMGVQKSLDTVSNMALINPLTYTFFKLPLVNGTIAAAGSKIGVDQYSSYPNTILNKDMGTANARECFSVWAQTEWGVTVPTDADASGDCALNWGLKFNNAGVTTGTTGFDGENNAWVLIGVDDSGPALPSHKTKLYRTAHDRDTGDGIDDSTTFPYGGESRYPAVQLKNWPFSFTNNREIEWFLTRNHGITTLNPVTLNTLETLDASTLDDSQSVNWYGSLNQTASAAWWSLVEEKMLRKHYVVGGNTWNTVGGYYKVYDTAGTLDGNAKKWGIRMAVSDIRTANNTLSGMNNDLFYETQNGAWKSEISNRIRAWSSAFASDTSYGGMRSDLVAGNVTGLKVHPHYKNATLAVDSYYINANLTSTQRAALETYAKSVKCINLRNLVVSYLYMYSDFTGNILQGSVDSSPLNRDIIHPDPTTPTLVLLTSGYQSNPGYQDTPAYCYPWKNTIPVSMSASYNAITGYDDFNVTYLVSSNMGSYLMSSFSLSTDDYWPSYLSDITNTAVLTPVIKNTSYNAASIYDSTAAFDYTYHSPSMDGLSGFTHPSSGRATGKFNPKTDVYVKDLYDYDAINGCNIVNAAANAYVTVLERWPEPKFFVKASDNVSVRQGQFCRKTWGISRFNKTSSLAKESNTTDAKRYDTTYGVDPISAVLQDRSIARTWPISSWNMTITTDNPRLGWSTKSFTVTSNGVLAVDKDEQNLFDTISAMPFRYGNYALTMNVQASTTMTSSDKPFVQYIQVTEFEPFANFWAISASTVSSGFSATNASITGQLVNVSPMHNGLSYPYVSGYAPNFTVFFQDSSEAHTFPISSYHWNFGDPFNEGPDDILQTNSNYYTVTTDQVTGDFNVGCWTTDVQAHTAVHTYIMPGTYDVTLTVRASCTSTSDICARYIDAEDSKRFYVYVEEIMPQCGNGVYGSLSPTTGFTDAASGITGGSPLTAYFMASGIIAGSFPICRMDWDFGDGNVQRITRYPLTQVTTQGLPVVNISAYSYDLEDPRNVVVPHVFVNQTEANQTLSINVSAYACNTNTMRHCYRTDLVSPLSAEINQPITDTKKLIGSRFDDEGNLVYILEGQNENTTYTIAMSGELN